MAIIYLFFLDENIFIVDLFFYIFFLAHQDTRVTKQSTTNIQNCTKIPLIHPPHSPLPHRRQIRVLCLSSYKDHLINPLGFDLEGKTYYTTNTT
ncbi:hypothetical protein GDO81_026959 [Engystomops pustulosus]|uniref:Uncharacterized protein n=1 Tax=Engystomops pustulosus TaxID=76066 RepID=A0AAV6ZER5_ENGPU|nr:hypothetical protein GDO81_026959 [Engystomops pustulosus]